MNRRSVIKNVFFISAGAALLPACMQDEKSTMVLSNLSLTASQEKMMASLTAAIIPSTKDFIGAADLKAHEFTLMMVNDCEPPEVQATFIEGMNAFNKLVKDKYSNDFTAITPAQQKELLLQLESRKDIPDTIQKFYRTTRNYTLQAFITSEKYLKEISGYKMVPGSNFKGCVPVSS